jgi:XTP/dITP diphosphohydrolase
VQADTAEQVTANWEQIKLKEKGGNKTVLAGVPDALPALVKAFRIQEKVANVGFDWAEPEQVWAKVEEEQGEVKEAIAENKQEEIEAEFGDLLFAVINAARLYNVNPENALERTNRKFIKRFNYIEQAAHDKNLNIRDLTLDQMEQLWQEAKSLNIDKK